MPQALCLDGARERARIVAFIRAQVAATSCGCAVLGLSGGIDSALCAQLCVEALGRENVVGMILPYASSNPESEAHARLVVQGLGIACERFEITPLVQPFLARYADMDGRRKGNIMARARMIALFDQSALRQGLVVGTSNRTETLLGYFTMHGDGAAAIKPIAHLYKWQVRALAQYVGVPDVIVRKAPTADLWEGQTDEGELGFTYDEADQVLYWLTERGLSLDETAGQGFARPTVEAISRRLNGSAFKRCAPPQLETVHEVAHG